MVYLLMLCKIKETLAEGNQPWYLLENVPVKWRKGTDSFCSVASVCLRRKLANAMHTGTEMQYVARKPCVRFCSLKNCGIHTKYLSSIYYNGICQVPQLLRLPQSRKTEGLQGSCIAKGSRRSTLAQVACLEGTMPCQFTPSMADPEAFRRSSEVQGGLVQPLIPQNALEGLKEVL